MGENFMYCANCGQKLELGQAFCPMCGERVTTGEEFRAPASSGSFAQPIKNDIENSESINMSNTQFQKSAGNIMANKKNRKIAFTVAYIAVGLIIVLCIVFNTHTCDACGKTYVGKEHTVVSVLAGPGKLCNSCYNELMG